VGSATRELHTKRLQPIGWYFVLRRWSGDFDWLVTSIVETLFDGILSPNLPLLESLRKQITQLVLVLTLAVDIGKQKIHAINFLPSENTLQLSILERVDD
jgi:hypothetical protein